MAIDGIDGMVIILVRWGGRGLEGEQGCGEGEEGLEEAAPAARLR